MGVPVLLITASLHIIHFYEMSKLTVSYIHLLQFLVGFATAGVGQCCQTVVVAPLFCGTVIGPWWLQGSVADPRGGPRGHVTPLATIKGVTVYL